MQSSGKVTLICSLTIRHSFQMLHIPFVSSLHPSHMPQHGTASKQIFHLERLQSSCTMTNLLIEPLHTIVGANKKTEKCYPMMNYAPIKLQLQNNWRNRLFSSLLFRKHWNINHLERDHLAVFHGELVIVFQNQIHQIHTIDPTDDRILIQILPGIGRVI